MLPGQVSTKFLVFAVVKGFAGLFQALQCCFADVSIGCAVVAYCAVASSKVCLVSLHSLLHSSAAAATTTRKFSGHSEWGSVVAMVAGGGWWCAPAEAAGWRVLCCRGWPALTPLAWPCRWKCSWKKERPW